MKRIRSSFTALAAAAAMLVSACRAVGMPKPAAGGGGTGAEPYAVRTLLREYTAADPETGIGVYGRYTELQPEEGAPETLKKAAEDCNRRAEQAVRAYVDAHVPGAAGAGTAGNGAAGTGAAGNSASGTGAAGINAEDVRRNEGNFLFTTYAYIATVTRADESLFSILETELVSEKPLSPGRRVTMGYSCKFRGTTWETGSGREIALSELTGDADPSQMMKEALTARYGVEDLAHTGPADYAWTADALGIRFFFHSGAVPEEKRQEAGFTGGWAVTAAVPYASLKGEAAATAANAPASYIALIDRETDYRLPGSGFSVRITEKDGDVVLRKTPDRGDAEDLIIEYADQHSEFYAMRAQDGFYLLRDRIAWGEGFLYDFSRPDGGFGRFASRNVQYFDSFLREVGLALPYNPNCVHMCERRRSFGEASYDEASFIPHGHYRFSVPQDGRYKRFQLADESLSIDTYNVACRLLEDFTVSRVDGAGGELGESVLKAGSALLLETVTGEGSLYLSPREQQQNGGGDYLYGCRLPDGTGARFVSKYESTIFSGGAYMNRFTKPVSLWEAQFEIPPAPEEAFTVRIGGTDYPVIPDYTKKDHVGEEIDFGGARWWEAEGWPGSYRATEEDRTEMKNGHFSHDVLAGNPEELTMEISAEGHVVLSCLGEVFEGDLPEKRFYRTDPAVSMTSKPGLERRTFVIRLREGEDHSEPRLVSLFSEGLPATNEPSKVPAIEIYMTKTGPR